MKLSEKTVNILKSFYDVNQSILIRPGNTIRTIASSKTVMAKVDVEENFDREFAIYDLGKLLGLISMFNDPELILDEKAINIDDGVNSVRYTYANLETIVSAPEREVKIPSVEFSANLSGQQLGQILKAAAVMGVQDITIRGDGTNVSIVAHDKKSTSSNIFSLDLGPCSSVFNVDFKSENFNMLIEDDYSVDISSKMISQFTGSAYGVQYWLACESTTSFG